MHGCMETVFGDRERNQKMRAWIDRINVFMKYKDLLIQLVSRDIKLKYRRSFLGYLWSVLNPLFVMIIMTIVFSTMFSRNIENFPVYLFTGKMLFDFMSNLKEYIIKLIKKELIFQEFLAVKDVSFKVKRGEAWALIGVNGSGKSTLLKAISGILKPYKGSITVNGEIAPLIELGAGFDPNLTARENIYLNGTVLGHSKKFMEEHFDEIVDFAELHDFLDTPIKNFSSGMSARLGFSIATMVKPEILIVDEILAVGDFLFQQKCMERMR